MIKKAIAPALLVATVLSSAHASTSGLLKGVELWEAFKCSLINTGNIQEQERLFTVGVAAGHEFCKYMDSLDSYNWSPRIKEGYSQLPPPIIISDRKLSCDFFLGQVYSSAIQEIYKGFDPKNLFNYTYWQQRYQLANCYYIGR